MRSRGFTLLEVVLAIGLTGAVLVLLTTAIDLYLVRVDSSRTRVESAQLARTLLTIIADDLRAARYDGPSAESEGEDASESSSDVDDSASVAGIYGTATELRIDRSAIQRWERITREVDPTEATTAAQMPRTVRYFVGEGSDLATDQLAAAGVSDQPLGTDYAGLYREQLASIELLSQASQPVAAQVPADRETAELLAPEVLEVEFAYFDGEELLPEWDSAVNQGLPSAVEIRLVMLEEPFELEVERRPSERAALRRSAENGVEYRLLVHIPSVLEPQHAESPRVGGQQDDNQPGNTDGSTS